jgi:hypothetical protein
MLHFATPVIMSGVTVLDFQVRTLSIPYHTVIFNYNLLSKHIEN